MAKKTRIDRLIEKGDMERVKKVVDRKEPRWDRIIERKEKKVERKDELMQKQKERLYKVATGTKRGEKRAGKEENKRWF